MTLHFEYFTRLATRAYQSIDKVPFSLQEALQVFQYYFQSYEEHMGYPHPNIRQEQTARIIRVMPWVDSTDVGGYYADLELHHYWKMIDQHFHTKYRNCDYNINHFFSGNIRLLRFYEVCY